MNAKLNTLLIVIVFLLVVTIQCFFTVDQRTNAIVFRLGEIISIKTEPGLYFKFPFLDNVRIFDIRINTVDPESPERFLTSEKKNVLVDSFIKWKISDVEQYYVSVAGDEQRARIRLIQTVNDSLRAEFGKRTINDVISGERDQIMDLMRSRVDDDAQKIGVEVLDVRLKRVDLTSEISEAVYRRMEAERKRVANELRSLGFAEAEKIKAQADREAEVIVAKGYKEAQNIKGFGDAKSAEIYGKAFSQDQNFYAFYRRLQAYEDSFQDRSDFIILDFDNDFFKFMQKPR